MHCEIWIQQVTALDIWIRFRARVRARVETLDGEPVPMEASVDRYPTESHVYILRAENPGGVVLLDAGDMLQGPLLCNHFEGAPVADEHPLYGVDRIAGLARQVKRRHPAARVVVAGCYAQTQPDALARRLGRVERIEDVGEDVRLHPAPRVLDHRLQRRPVARDFAGRSLVVFQTGDRGDREVDDVFRRHMRHFEAAPEHVVQINRPPATYELSEHTVHLRFPEYAAPTFVAGSPAELVEAAAQLGVASMPGTHTPTEMLRAHRAGAQLCKLFPAPAGGPAWVRSVLGPMPWLKIVPTNGVDEHNAADWIAAGVFGVGFVAPLFPADDLVAGRWDAIEARAARCMAAVRGA